MTGIIRTCKNHGALTIDKVRLHRKATSIKPAYYRCIQCYEIDLAKQRVSIEKRVRIKREFTRSSSKLTDFNPPEDNFCRTDADLSNSEIDEIFVNLKIDNLGYV